MTNTELEAFFLNHNDSYFEKIQNAKNLDDALVWAYEALDDEEIKVDSKQLITVVEKIREG